MKTLKNLIPAIAIVAAILLVANCGGGGNSGGVESVNVQPPSDGGNQLSANWLLGATPLPDSVAATLYPFVYPSGSNSVRVVSPTSSIQPEYVMPSQAAGELQILVAGNVTGTTYRIQRAITSERSVGSVITTTLNIGSSIDGFSRFFIAAHSRIVAGRGDLGQYFHRDGYGGSALFTITARGYILTNQILERVVDETGRGGLFDIVMSENSELYELWGTVRTLLANGRYRNERLTTIYPTIPVTAQICRYSFIIPHLPPDVCPGVARSARIIYTPAHSAVLGGVMDDLTQSGFSFYDGLRFYGRYGGNNGGNKKAGFSYDFGGYAFRADFAKLPAKQDDAVMLNTYRFGVMPNIGGGRLLFVGTDNYQNAIVAINISGDLSHRFGVAVGDGYAVKYEFRLDL